MAKGAPKLTIISEAERSDLTIKSLASGGPDLYATGYGELLGATGNTFKRVGKPGSVRFFDEALAIDGKIVWACGHSGVRRSTDLGLTFKDVSAPAHKLHAIAIDAVGTVWAAGDDGKVIAWRGKRFELVPSGDKDVIGAVVPTTHGVVMPSQSGAICVAKDGKVKRTVVAKTWLAGACATPTGTIVVVGGHNKTGGTAFRSVDGGKTYKAAKLAGKPSALKTVLAVPDGRVIAGGIANELAISHDDGATFTPIKFKSKAFRAFTSSTLHDSAAYFSGPFQAVVRIE